jgi:hypothetical protein
MKFKSGDLVKFVHTSNLLMSIQSNLVGCIGVVIEKMDPDSLESFYLVAFSDRMVSVAEHQIVVAGHSHTHT